MHTLTPVSAIPGTTQADAKAALQRLIDSNTTLSNELMQLPVAPQDLIDALSAQSAPRIEQELSGLLHRLDAFWLDPAASGEPRFKLFATRLQESLHAEALLKSHENDLQPDAAGCLATRRSADAQTPGHRVSTSSLHVMLHDQAWVEIKGALVMTDETGRTLLALPGSGLSEFPTPHAMAATVALWLNDKTLRRALLINADQRHQDALFAVADDPELFIDAFAANHVHLEEVSGNPYRYALSRQADKQREDVCYLCGDGSKSDTEQQVQQIGGAIGMAGLLTPSAMLERREQALIERKIATNLPHWIKIASPGDLKTYTNRLKRYDQAREALSSALNGATSADQYAQVSVKIRVANDLGYDIDPESITISTRRRLPETGETYTLTRSLTQLALYGLHPGDQQSGSAFLNDTTIDIDSIPAAGAYPLLTPQYLAAMIDDLQLRTTFGDYQKEAYAKDANQTLMRDLLRLQISEQACAAKMQGHISPEDFDVIETIAGNAPGRSDGVLSVQHLNIHGNDVLGRILVFRKESPQGQLQRLIMFTSDAPRDRQFQAFHNETQLLHELVGWTAIPEMTDYLLQQLSAPNRSRLDQTLGALNKKPHPEPGFLQFVLTDSFDTSLRTFVAELIKVSVSNHETHTPDWYLQGSELQRQTLVALEDAAIEGIKHYENQTHTGVEEFESYVHRRASEKICQLLKVPTGTVNPDQIIITSERETLTYTQMIRDGYDDSLGFITPTADTVATFRGPEGVDLSSLTPESVAGSVRGKWLADGYISLIRSTLLNPDSTGYQYRRQTSTAIKRLQMQAAALRSLLKGHIDGLQYQWLEKAVSNVHQEDTDLRRRFPIYPLQIHIDKPFIASRVELLDQLVIPDTNLIHVETVQGCFVLLAAENRLSPLLYTPQAPDGVEFRLFSSFTESLSRPGMIDYYKDRCRIKARRVLSFFLRDMKDGNAHKAPFIPRDSIADFAQTCFNRPIERKLRDVDETTTGRHDMLSNLIWNSVEIIAVALTLPFPPASFAVGVALSLHFNFKALQALTGDSPEDASAYILASVLNTAGAAGDFAVGLKGFGGMARKLARDTKKGALPAALRKPSDLPSQNELYPIKLHDEPFLIGKPNLNGQARVYRGTELIDDDVRATGHYAARDRSGTWQPLGETSPPTSTPLAADRAVDIYLPGLPRMTAGHANGVSLGQGKYYIEMNRLVYQVNYDPSLHCWHIVDPQNPFAFFGRQPVRLDEHGQWQLIERSSLRGGGQDRPSRFLPLEDEAAGGEAAHAGLHEYELPENVQPHMEAILSNQNLDPIGMGMEAVFEVLYTPMRQTYTTLRTKLYRDAAAFFAEPPIPPRPSLPAIDATTTVDSFLEDAFNHSNGLVLSEGLKSVASKRMLITHMSTLTEQRVELIYLPHLFTDKHVQKLAKYRAKGRSVRAGSREIKEHLKSLNEGALNNQSDRYDYYHVIKEAHRHGIEIRPLSASTSYPVNVHPVAIAAADNTAAQKMSNFAGHKIISADVAADPSRRWVALLDEKLATTHDEVAGIAELQAAISVHIDDVPAGQATHISPGAGRAGTTSNAAPCDFTIELANPGMARPAAAAMPTELDNALFREMNRHRAVPADNSHAGENGFRWDETSGWQRVTPEEWIADTPPTAIQQSLADAAYEMPSGSRDVLHDLANFRRRGLDEGYFFSDPEVNSVRDEFFALRRKLHRDARQVISAERPPRPVMPDIGPQTEASEFIERLYRHTDGMVIGEFHNSIGSKKFIMENLPLLAEQNVKTLYMEHLLVDLHQADLDRFFETGLMSKRLLHDLKQLDRGHQTDPAKIFTFEKLVIQAQRHGIEIRAIDCATSYHLKGIPHTRSTTRQQMMNFFASRTIRRHQEVIGQHKWVALVGNSHSNTYANNIPGLAELEGAIGIRLNDVLPGTSRGIAPDAGEHVRLPLSSKTEFLKGDFRIEMEIVQTPVALRPPMPLPLEQRLSKAGMFVTEMEPGNQHVIIHRSRTLELHRTPVRINAAGKVYVDRPTWAGVHMQRYEDIDALIQALEEINLTRVA
ncbi:dermonecrotic toxin domain-containing protein [Pseudomonas abietaniphila]